MKQCRKFSSFLKFSRQCKSTTPGVNILYSNKFSNRIIISLSTVSESYHHRGSIGDRAKDVDMNKRGRLTQSDQGLWAEVNKKTTAYHAFIFRSKLGFAYFKVFSCGGFILIKRTVFITRVLFLLLTMYIYSTAHGGYKLCSTAE